MIETLMLAVSIEEEQLETARKENWSSESLLKALNGTNETAQNIRTAREHGRVTRQMERTLFKRLGKVAKAYMVMGRKAQAEEAAKRKADIGEIKVVQREFEDGTVETELMPADHEEAIVSDLDGTIIELKSEVDLSMDRPLKEQVKLRTDFFASPEKIRDAMAMEKSLKAEDDLGE